MGLFTRRRQTLALTPEAVAAPLLDTGFPVAETDEHGHARTEGFMTWINPVSHEDRVGVGWHVDIYAYDDPRGIEASFLVDMASVLEQAGYQAEIVDELTSSYLVVWVKGGF